MFRCGASIINKRWVLTAAHCTANQFPQYLSVVVGSVLLNSGGAAYRVSRFIDHPNYDPQNYSNDISVIQTTTDIIFNSNVQPIALGSAFVSGGVRAVASGWGSTTTGGPTPNNLQHITLTTLTNADCLNRVGSNNHAFVPESKICTLTRAGEGVCQGDSGGPLAAENTVIGVASWAFYCALGLPDGFERVAYFRGWILTTIA
jgi:trypsin